ncbi:hypothetical protein EDB81DRAFT_944394 [Dactylonectria macrodidyma]|uniref:Zn(2)-C6 fungal-type domain-containing protein n=1 Tax=Dactylonectria macrodidyma TaxID=307937 RepID=A0A9P9JHL2_9HYPO|nr:hypothetical protein EDB81DRAFT_944394 [Dactylonectria macrodidyma]
MAEPEPDELRMIDGGVQKQVSCERCKRRKSKCDRRHPTCERCRSAGASCEYSGRRKPGFPAGQRLVLEARIKSLEAALHQLQSVQGIAGGNGPSDAPTELQPIAMPTPPRGNTGRDARTDANLSPSSHDPVNVEGDRTSANVEPDPGVPLRLLTEPPQATSKRTENIMERKPPIDLVVSLMSLYSRHIHPWLPFLDPQRLFMEAGSTDDPSLLSYALFGVSLPFSFDPRLNNEASDRYWKYCKRRIFIETVEEPSYTALEALTVLLLDVSGMTNGPQVWGTLAVATRLAGQLKTVGGHTFRISTGHSPDTSQFRPDQVHLRRLFWTIYALDCYISITTSHQSNLADTYTQHFLPTRDQTWSDRQDSASITSNFELHEQPLCIFRYQLKLLDLSRRLHKFCIDYVTILGSQDTISSDWIQSFMERSSELSEWPQNIPDLLPSSSWNQPRTPMVGPRVMLHGYYHALKIHLHGPVAFASQHVSNSRLSDFSNDSRESCTESLEALVDLLQHMNRVMDKVGWPFAWAIWTAARYILVAEYNGFQIPSNQFDALLECLGRLGKYWQIGRKYWRLLRYGESELKGRGGPGGADYSPLLQSIVDLRVPTCDLEDRFRVDPFLHDTAPVDTEVATVNERAFSQNKAPIRDTNPLSFQYEFNFSGWEMNSWVPHQLFASSAYQQSPPLLFNNNENSMMED